MTVIDTEVVRNEYTLGLVACRVKLLKVFGIKMRQKAVGGDCDDGSNKDQIL